jgi:hypothetical protein
MMLLAMNTHISSSRPSVRLAALVHRWPSAVGLLAAGLFLGGANRASVALVVAIAATCYVAAAAFSLPWMAWAWIPLSFVVVLAGVLVELDPLVATAGSAAVLVVVGLLWGAARPALTLEVAGLLLYGSIAVGALLLAPAAGVVVVAATLVAHGIGTSGTCAGTATSSPRPWRRRAWRSTSRSAWLSSSRFSCEPDRT